MIQTGEKLDLQFTVKVVEAGAVREVRFADLLTRRTIVSVYMKNRTPGCDRQVDSLIAQADEFDRAGFNLVAVSRDTCGSHQRYMAAKAIPFVLASDPDDRFAKAAGILVQKSMYGRTFTGPLRSAFVLDRDGTVRAIVEKVDTAKHAEQLHAVIRSL